MQSSLDHPIEATVMVLTRNSAETLPTALASVKGFAEIIVCDGDSSDATVEIALEHGAIVIEQDAAFLDADGRLADYAGARHQVVRSASQPWIFHLDADEIATPELTSAIGDLGPDDADIAAYQIGARHVVDDRPVRSAANYPMSFTRVFRRDAVRGYFGPINEHPEFDDDARIARLDGEFLIPMPPLPVVLSKWFRYQRIVARDARIDGLHPLPTFREEIRVVRWLAWRTWKSHRHEPGPHMPLRYDISRVGFHLVMSANGLVNRLARPLFKRSPETSS